MLIDTHCHVDAYFRLAEVVADAEKHDVNVVAVTNTPSAFKRLSSTLRHEKFRIAVGMHPLEAINMMPADVKAFHLAMERTRYVGEVGLDFSAIGGKARHAQERIFALVCEALRERPRITTVHSRGAIGAVLDHLNAAGAGPVIFHWFSGSYSDLERIIVEGHLCSFNAPMCISNKGQDVLRRIPKERVLVETDGPYATTGGRPTWPSDSIAIASKIARVWDSSEHDAQRQINQNFRNLSDSVFASSDARITP